MAIATKDRRGRGPRRYNNFYSWRGDFYPAEITAPTARQKELRAARWVVAVFTGLALLSMAWLARDSVAAFMTLLSDQEAVSSYVQSYGAWGPLVLGLAQMVQVLVAFIPGHVFVIAAGYVYGFPAGFALNLVCVVAASQLAYSLARWAGRPVVNRLAPPDLLDKWQKIADRQGVMFFTIAFLLPVFPTDAMNFAAGLSGLSPRRFLTANVLGRLPHSVVLTLIGSHGLELTSFAWGILAVSVIAVYVTGRYVIMGIERRHSPGAPAPSGS